MKEFNGAIHLIWELHCTAHNNSSVQLGEDLGVPGPNNKLLKEILWFNVPVSLLDYLETDQGACYYKKW